MECGVCELTCGVCAVYDKDSQASLQAVGSGVTHHRLDQHAALRPDVLEEPIHIHRPLPHDPLQHGVQYHEGPCAPHPCTAVDEKGNPLVSGVGPLDLADKAHH